MIRQSFCSKISCGRSSNNASENKFINKLGRIFASLMCFPSNFFPSFIIFVIHTVTP